MSCIKSSASWYLCMSLQWFNVFPHPASWPHLFQVKFFRDAAMVSKHESIWLSINCKIINQDYMTQYDLQIGKIDIQNFTENEYEIA